MLKINVICPACGKTYSGYPALSRKDNKTEICGACGLMEAISDYHRSLEKAMKEGRKHD